MNAPRLVRRRPAPDARLPADLHPVLRRVYAARGIHHPEQLDLRLHRLHRPDGLPDLDTASGLLARAIMQGQRILVVGDFDADGATGTALAVRALSAMGAAGVSFLVPSRFRHGYGLSPAVVEAALSLAPDVLLTVDNGVAAIAGVAAARAAGMRVVVTDHHLPGERLPDADALVNPCLPRSGFPSRALCGAGVVFYVMAALRRALEERGWFGPARPAPRLADWLDLVALGTVADVVPLDHNNRILVQQGLERIRRGTGNAGIRALLEVAGRDPAHATAADLGFVAGPRLNAAGRLEDMELGIRCLLADDTGTAREWAEVLDRINGRRRVLESRMSAEAETQVARLATASQGLPAVLCLHDPDWHEGVIGLVAGRVRERFHRPAVAFARGTEGRLKGSARSVPALHMRDALAAVDARHPGLIDRFGGHAMAAGLTLAAHHLAEFSQALETAALRALGGAPPVAEIVTDGPLEPHELELETALALEAGGPWGQAFPPPTFDGRFEVLDARPVGGGRHLRLLLRPETGRRPVPGILFHAAEHGWRDDMAHLHLVYHPAVNRYGGGVRLQVRVDRVLPSGVQPAP